jgi:hypothetical protein
MVDERGLAEEKVATERGYSTVVNGPRVQHHYH